LNRDSYDAFNGKPGNFRSRDDAPFPDSAMRDDVELAPEWFSDGRQVSLGTDVGATDYRQPSDFRSSGAGTIGEFY
jgi:hypothetical protein